MAADVMECLPVSLSHFEAPATVRISASRPALGNEITLHCVNYNREEPAEKRSSGQGIKDEKPIAAPVCQADLKLGGYHPVRHMEFLTPEHDHTSEMAFEQVGTRLRFRVPTFLVYGVVRIQFSKSE